MLYNLIIEKIILPIGDLANGSSFLKYLKAWRKIQYFSEEDLSNLQKKNLKNLLNHASNFTQFYAYLKDKEVENPYEWLKSFPIIRKSDIKGKENLFFSTIEKGKKIEYASSGSSGIQGKVYMNKEEQSIIRAIMVLWWEWAGYKIGNMFFQTGMTPNRGFLKTIKDLVFRTTYIIAFRLSEEQLLPAIKKMTRKGKKFIGGYASSLYVLAQTTREKGIDNIDLNGVISWGDKMFPHYRKEIFEVWNTKVFDTYACNEGIMIAAQKDLEYYYILSPHVFLELVDVNGNPVADGELGYVLVTRLDGFSMPLIRYYLGDLAIKLPKEEYPINRQLNFPLLKFIIGRDTDVVITPSGKTLIVHFFTGIFEFFPTIRQFRVVQEDIHSIIIEYIKEPDFLAEDLDRITLEMNKHVLGELKFLFKEVSEIPSTPSGKPQIIQSKLKHGIQSTI